MKLAFVVDKLDEFTVVQIGIEIVDADHRAPFIQEVEMKDQLVDAFKTDLTLNPEFGTCPFFSNLNL